MKIKVINTNKFRPQAAAALSADSVLTGLVTPPSLGTSAFVATPAATVPHLPVVGIRYSATNWAQFTDRDYWVARCDNNSHMNVLADVTDLHTRAPGNRYLQYVIIMSVMDPALTTGFTSTFDQLSVNFYTYHMQPWYAANPQYNIEDAFLHEDDGSGICTTANRRRRSIYAFANQRWIINPADPGYRAYTIARLTQLFTDNSCQGFWVDECANNRADGRELPLTGSRYVWRGCIKSVNGLKATSNNYPLPGADATQDALIHSDLQAFATAIRAGLPSSAPLLWNITYAGNMVTGDIYSANARAMAKATGCGNLEQFMLLPDPTDIRQRWNAIDDLQSGAITVYGMPPDDSGLTTWQNTTANSVGNEATFAQRARMFWWTAMLMTYRDQAHSWYAYPYTCNPRIEGTHDATPPEAAAWKGFWPMWQLNVGTPTGPRTLVTWSGMPADDSQKLRSGDTTHLYSGANGQAYAIYQRTFSTGMIAYCRGRPLNSAHWNVLTDPLAKDGYFNDFSIVTVPLPPGIWYRMTMGGSLIGPINSIDLRQIEGAVIVPG